MNQLPNIDFSKPVKNPTIDAETSDYELPFYKTRDYFGSLDNYVNFIKACEKFIRSSNYYSRYVKYIKEEVGLSCCQVLSNIQDDYSDDDGPHSKGKGMVEMHHGPILTLFDYVQIVVDWMLFRGMKINTFQVADIVLQEHYDNNVQIVMLSKTVHEQADDNNIFINISQAFGNLNRFLSKYFDGLQADQIQKINDYIKKSEQFDSFDNNLLTLEGAVKRWKRENGE